jgi:hypothetical protein
MDKCLQHHRTRCPKRRHLHPFPSEGLGFLQIGTTPENFDRPAIACQFLAKHLNMPFDASLNVGNAAQTEHHDKGSGAPVAISGRAGRGQILECRAWLKITGDGNRSRPIRSDLFELFSRVGICSVERGWRDRLPLCRLSSRRWLPMLRFHGVRSGNHFWVGSTDGTFDFRNRDR